MDEVKVKDMTSLAFDPPDGFVGRSIFPNPVTTPSYMELWEVEKGLNFHEWRMWIGSRTKWPVHFCFIYIMVMFLGQIWMRRRPPLQGGGIRRLMVLWNLALALFSLTGFLRSWPEVVHLLNRPNGFYRITCSREEYNNASAFWSVVGTFSKVIELGDTAFLVLRKRPVIFLHWFHHATVMLYTWGTFEYLDPCHRWFIVMNYFIHAIMYLYYAVRGMGFSVSKNLSMLLTTLQLGQMVAGLGLNVYSLILMNQGVPCARRPRNVHMSMMMYGSYLILFAQFFYSNYLDKDEKCGCRHRPTTSGPSSSSSLDNEHNNDSRNGKDHSH